MTVIGIDIGTTSISINISDRDSGKVVDTKTIANSSGIQSKAKSYEDLQDAEYIFKLVAQNLDEIIMKYGTPGFIGVTGQMHGIVYIDCDGMAVSPLYTWRDNSAGETDPSGDGMRSYAQQLSYITNSHVATGWGMSTLYCHTVKKSIPEKAVSVCTISDYIAMRLSGKKNTVIHISNAASMGLFDMKNNCFDMQNVIKAGINADLIPEVTSEYAVTGYFKGNIPVCVAIGDNQAGFLSSVYDEKNSVLANLGTGGQISFATDYTEPKDGLELRPLVKDKFILVGSSLCGGMALSILEDFFRKTAELVANHPVQSAYVGIDRCLSQMLPQIQSGASVKPRLNISTRFCGTRSNTSERGYIMNIDMSNFTPEDMICGFLYGMANELHDMYEISGASGRHTKLVGSGNAVRKNLFLQHVLADVFGMQIFVPTHIEEAAYGATIFGTVCSGVCSDIDAARKRITYL